MSSRNKKKGRRRNEISITAAGAVEKIEEECSSNKNHTKEELEEEGESSIIPEGVLPSYLAECFGELYQEDGLVVFGKGLGWLSLLASFIRFYGDVEEGHVALLFEEKKMKKSSDNNNHNNADDTTMKPPLVLVIGLKETERHTLLSILETWGTPPELLPTIITNESGQGKDRAVMYARGGVFCITSRILIVDLLSNVANAKDIDGILVAHAENVTEESTEAFILRIFHSHRQQNLQNNNGNSNNNNNNNNNINKNNNNGFVKAFSDSPDVLMSGFAKIDKILKALRVRRLYLYPRFHHNIKEELENFSPHVDELYQELSPKMKEIQNALAAAVQSCIRELKGTTTLLDWTATTTTVDDNGGANRNSNNNSTSSSSNNNDKSKKKGTENHNELVLSVENCVTSHFDRMISKQLEHDWHRLKPGTKQLIQDLRTLRTLFQSLIQYDCITFWKLINSIKTMSAASKYPSMWLLSPAADLLFRKAKERIYTIVDCGYNHSHNNKSQGRKRKQESQQQQSPRVTKRLKTILEEMPKWKLLKQVLFEISEAEKEKKNNVDEMKKSEMAPDDDEYRKTSLLSTTTNVLVMVKDERTCEGIQSYLVDGKKYTMTKRWLRYLDHCNDRLRNIADNRGGMHNVSEESRLLIEEEGRARRLLFGGSRNRNKKRDPFQLEDDDEEQQQLTSKQEQKKRKQQRFLNQIPEYMRKRRRIAVERGRGTLTQQQDDIERQAVLHEAVEKTEHELAEEEQKEEDGRGFPYAAAAAANAATAAAAADSDDDNQEKDEEEVEEAYKTDIDDIMFDVALPPNELRVILKSYSSINSGDHALLLLQDLRPKYVVLYDADVSFVRAVEIYSSLYSTKEQRVRVFFLIFEASAEEKNFMKTLEREQNAFERLIHHKKTMPPPVWQTSLTTQEMQYAQERGTAIGGTYMGGSLPLAFDTRRGRGKKAGKRCGEMRDIAVDVREFRSALPSILHQGGMRLAPVTLTIGDFVLSNVHCVERKSVGDLFGSFASGRLYTQAEAMCKHYKCPCLLIEFDPSKSFCLQNSNELGIEIRTDSICSKMALLTIHFPKLRILWSRSPHHTLQIFKELKTNHEEVNVGKAVEVGRSESVEGCLSYDNSDAKRDDDGEDNDDEDEEDEINEMAREMLMRLPGVNVHSARRIMQECDTLAELAEMSRDDLRKVAGPITGQKLFTFFRQNMAAT